MTVSPNGTFAVGPGASVTDAQGKVYAINAAGQITINGRVDPTTARVDALGYSDGLVWQKNEDNLWYSKTSATATWVDFPAANGVPLALPASANNTVIQPSGAGPASNPLHDASGNTWSINLAGQVVIDGRIDPTTARVVQMDLVNGMIWQENADGNWYSKTKPSDTWTSAVRTDPIVTAAAAAEAWIGGTGNNSPALGSNWSKGRAPMPHQSLTMTTGTMNLGSGNLSDDTLTIAGQRPAPNPVDHTVYGGYEAIAPIINMTAGGRLTMDFALQNTNAAKVNITGGQVVLAVSNPYPSTADLIVTADKLSSVLLHANMVFGKMTETGGTVLLNGDSNFAGTAVTLNSDLAGTGTMTMGPAQASLSTLEVTGAVGAGVTIFMRGAVVRGSGAVILDKAAADHGTIMLQNAFLELKGTGPVDSVSYTNSILTLFHGNIALESIKLIGVADPIGTHTDGHFSFGKDAAGTVYASNGYGVTMNPILGYPPPSITALPIHA